jgi:hypothetical protein
MRSHPRGEAGRENDPAGDRGCDECEEIGGEVLE